MGIFRTGYSAGAAIVNSIYAARARRDMNRAIIDAQKANIEARKVFVWPDNSYTPSIFRSKLKMEESLNLISKKDLNDVTTYTPASTPGTACNYVSHYLEQNGNLVISGGAETQRNKIIAAFFNNIGYKKVLLLHRGNYGLVSAVKNYFGQNNVLEFGVNSRNYFNPLSHIPPEQAAEILYYAMPINTSINAQTILRALLLFFNETRDSYSIADLKQYQIQNLLTDVNDPTYQLDAQTKANIIGEYTMGSNEPTAVSSVIAFLNTCGTQLTNMFGTRGGRPEKNLFAAMNANHIVCFDIGNGINSVASNVLFSNLNLLLGSNHQSYSMIVDGIDLGASELLTKLFSAKNLSWALSYDDFFSGLGMHENADQLFDLILGIVSVVVLFRHFSGHSSSKWSGQLGTYRKYKVNYGMSQNIGVGLNGAGNRNISIEEEEAPRVTSNTLDNLPGNVACIHNNDETLFIDVI